MCTIKLLWFFSENMLNHMKSTRIVEISYDFSAKIADINDVEEHAVFYIRVSLWKIGADYESF